MSNFPIAPAVTVIEVQEHLADETARQQPADNPGDVKSEYAVRRRIPPLLLFLTGIAALVESVQLSLGVFNNPGPGLWPFIISLAVIVTAGLLMIFPDASVQEKWTRRTLAIAGGVGSIGIFVILFEILGFVIPAILLLLLWLRAFAHEPWRWALPLAVGGAVVFDFVFVELLGVPFPDDIADSVFSQLIGI